MEQSKELHLWSNKKPSSETIWKAFILDFAEFFQKINSMVNRINQNRSKASNIPRFSRTPAELPFIFESLLINMQNITTFCLNVPKPNANLLKCSPVLHLINHTQFTIPLSRPKNRFAIFAVCLRSFSINSSWSFFYFNINLNQPMCRIAQKRLQIPININGFLFTEWYFVCYFSV